MARETKVGLIVGLGVILFVSVFVSDYLSDPENADAINNVPTPNYVQQTTNQDVYTLVREDDTQPATPTVDPAEFAAASLENIERQSYTPSVTIGPPPFRDGPSLTDPIDDTTPIAFDPRAQERALIGQTPIDDTHLAMRNQLDRERIGPGSDPLADMAHVEIPGPQLTVAQPTKVEHKVGPGETLTAIARKHYDGDGNMWRSIRDANPGKVGPNGEVVQGVVLLIPKRSTETPEHATPLTSGTGTGGADRPQRTRVRMVTVQEGQTLSELAAEHLGSAGKWQLIMDVNTDVLKKPEQLRVGMKLRIPAEPVVEVIEEANRALATGAGETQPERPQPTTTANANTYTVKEGDSLYRIAQKMLGDGDRYDEIYQANKDKLSSASDIKVGMTLKLPAR